MRMTFEFQGWKDWSAAVELAVGCFQQELGAIPNIILVNEATRRRVNIAANRDHVRTQAGEEAPTEGYVDLQGISGPDWNLILLTEEEVPENCFALTRAEETR